MSNEAEEHLIMGIDLGTTNSVVAIPWHQQIKVVYNKVGSRTTPSCVYYDPVSQEILKGKAAQQKIKSDGANCIYETKRMMGLKYSDDAVSRNFKYWSYKVEEGEDCRPVIKVTWNKKPKYLHPENVAAIILQSLAEDVKAFARETKDAVITVPAYFDSKQRIATRDAAEIAGLNCLYLLPEPTAAALAYNMISSSGKPFMVYDLGGGTFDVTILKAEGGRLITIGLDGDIFLGGGDFDKVIMHEVANEIKRKTGRDALSDQEQRLKGALKAVCEEAKHGLSQIINYQIYVDSVEVTFELTRARFENSIRAPLNRTITICKNLLEKHHLQPSDLECILLIGGSSLIPKVKTLLKQHFKDIPLKANVNAAECIAMGAAQLAQTMMKRGHAVQNLHRALRNKS